MSCISPIEIKVYDKKDTFLGYRLVPCGKCVGCLRRRRASWSYRIYQEYRSAVCSWFVTLTYDNEHLPVEGVNKRDIQLFLKRFRKMVKCRYFLCSEYGDTFGRPHYHAILFFPEMVDLTQVVKMVDSAWQNGNIQVGNVTIASINYVSKYSLKPRIDETGVFPNKTFSMMSRNPGIGYDALADPNLTQIHREDLDPTVQLDGFTYSMPRYYQDKIFTKTDKLKINQKIQEKYGNKERKPQTRTQEWMWQVQQTTRRFSHR